MLFLIQFGAATTLVVAPAILINRLLARSEGGNLADLFAIPLDPPWPRGMQEEEPTRWRIDALRPAARAGTSPADAARPRPSTHTAPLGTETGRCV